MSQQRGYLQLVLCCDSVTYAALVFAFIYRVVVQRGEGARFDVLDLRQQRVLLIKPEPCKFGVAVEGGVVDALMLSAAHACNHAPLGAHGQKQLQRWPVFFPHPERFGRGSAGLVALDAPRIGVFLGVVFNRAGTRPPLASAA